MPFLKALLTPRCETSPCSVVRANSWRQRVKSYEIAILLTCRVKRLSCHIELCGLKWLSFFVTSFSIFHTIRLSHLFTRIIADRLIFNLYVISLWTIWGLDKVALSDIIFHASSALNFNRLIVWSLSGLSSVRFLVTSLMWWHLSFLNVTLVWLEFSDNIWVSYLAVVATRMLISVWWDFTWASFIQMMSLCLIYSERELVWVHFVWLWFCRWLALSWSERVLIHFLLWQFLSQESCSLRFLTNLIDWTFDHTFIIVETSLAFEANYLSEEGVLSEFFRIHIWLPIKAVERRSTSARLGGHRRYW